MSSFTRQRQALRPIANSQGALRLLLLRDRRFGAMRPTAMDFFGDMGDQGSTMAMDVDDVDALQIFGGQGSEKTSGTYLADLLPRLRLASTARSTYIQASLARDTEPASGSA